MKTSPLRLDDAFICEIELRSSEQGTSSSVKHSDVRVDAQPTYSRFINDPWKWKVELDVSFGGSEESPVPYEGRIACRGYFTLLDESMPEEKQCKVVAVNSASILYATAREAVASLTGRGEYGMLLLPSVSFIDHAIAAPDDGLPKAEAREVESVEDHEPLGLEDQEPEEESDPS